MFLIEIRFSTYLDLYVFMKQFVRLTSSPKSSKGLLPAAPQERYSSNSGLIERLPRSSPLANDKPNWLFDKPNLFFCEFFIWDIWEASGRAAIFKDNKQDWKKQPGLTLSGCSVWKKKKKNTAFKISCRSNNDRRQNNYQIERLNDALFVTPITMAWIWESLFNYSLFTWFIDTSR